MTHHVLIMQPVDKDLITAQIAARNGKSTLFVKAQRGTDRLADNFAKLASHSLFTLIHQQITKIIYAALVAQHV